MRGLRSSRQLPRSLKPREELVMEDVDAVQEGLLSKMNVERDYGDPQLLGYFSR